MPPRRLPRKSSAHICADPSRTSLRDYVNGQKLVQKLMKTVGVRVDSTERSSVYVRVRSPKKASVNVSVRYCDSDNSSSEEEFSVM